MLLQKVTCQACGETDQVNNDSNHDALKKFFVWPSHTDHTGLNIYAFFCFSCGSINSAAPLSSIALMISSVLESTLKYSNCICSPR